MKLVMNSSKIWCKNIQRYFPLHIDPLAPPKFHKPRTVPYALKGLVEEELECLMDLGIIIPVIFSKWAVPIVPVLKHGSMRLCGDYKVTISQVLKVDSYPLPKVEDLFSALAGGKYFCKLDMAQAYLQLPLDQEPQEFTTINTHKYYLNIVDYYLKCLQLQPYSKRVCYRVWKEFSVTWMTC